MKENVREKGRKSERMKEESEIKKGGKKEIKWKAKWGHKEKLNGGKKLEHIWTIRVSKERNKRFKEERWI